MITRFVAINLLFTASPRYDPALSPPKLPTNIQLDINLYRVDQTVDPHSLINESDITTKLARLQPYNVITSDTKEVPYRGDSERTFNCWASFQPCYGGRQLSDFFFGDMFLFHLDHLNQYLEGDADYEVPIFVYISPHQYDSSYAGGVADDNWADGTQSLVYLFHPRFITDLGVGMSGGIIHETGHHLSLSHPHDGYDSELQTDYSAYENVFAWSGDESASVMGYLANNSDFSQFDRDNIDRNMVLTYINQSNLILGTILASSHAGQVSDLLTRADQKATSAVSRYQAMDYLAAVFDAQDAYQKIVSATQQINVPVEKQAWPADYRARGNNYMFTDDFNRFRRP